MLDQLAGQSLLDFHRRILIEANLNHIKLNPLDHGLSDSAVLNLQALDHKGNYEREMDNAFEIINELYREEHPFNVKKELQMNEKDQIIYWSVESKNPKMRDYINSRMPVWIDMIRTLINHPNYLYECSVDIDRKL